MEEFNKSDIPLTREQKAALYVQAHLLIERCNHLLLEARAKHEQYERELCYPIQVSQVTHGP